MVLEIAEIDVLEGHAESFEQAVAEAIPLFRTADGCRSMELNRSSEHPLRYRLVIGWDRIEDHMATFRKSAAFERWRMLAGPHFAAAPRVEHVTTVVKGF